jgi:hypothetical protein
MSVMHSLCSCGFLVLLLPPHESMQIGDALCMVTCLSLLECVNPIGNMASVPACTTQPSPRGPESMASLQHTGPTTIPKERWSHHHT